MPQYRVHARKSLPSPADQPALFGSAVLCQDTACTRHICVYKHGTLKRRRHCGDTLLFIVCRSIESIHGSHSRVRLISCPWLLPPVMCQDTACTRHLSERGYCISWKTSPLGEKKRYHLLDAMVTTLLASNMACPDLRIPEWCLDT